MTAMEIDFKLVESCLQNKFARPFARRLTYIYFGLNHDDNIFVLSDTEDTGFKFCEARQTTGLVKLTNPDELAMLNAWLLHYNIDRHKSYMFHFSVLMALMNKTKWHNPDITTRIDADQTIRMTIPGVAEDKIIANIIDAHYTLTRLQNFVDKYSKVFFKNESVYFDIKPQSEKNNGFISLNVSAQDLFEKRLLKEICRDFRLTLLEGLDLLIIKALLKKDTAYQFEIRLWADNSLECINFGSYYKDDDVHICASRDNIFMFPIKQ